MLSRSNILCMILSAPVFAVAVLLAPMSAMSADPALGVPTIFPLISAAPAAVPASAVPAPSVPAPAVAVQPKPLPPPSPTNVFGTQMFTGNFRLEQFSGFNPNYQISIGDKITLRMWGAVTLEGSLPVDPQGNIFVPNVGPVYVLGVRNGELNSIVETGIKRVYRSNVGVYASLDAAQPVKVFVTGFVRHPGLYSGLSSDSVLRYLDMAGGVDPDRGSFLDIAVRRGDQVRKTVNLYDFLLYGKMDLLQMADGDTIVVGPKQYSITVSGDVQNPYQFEFGRDRIPLVEALSLARPKAAATDVSILRQQGSERRNEYYPIDKVGDVVLNNGDEVTVRSDKYPGTMLVRVEGAISSSHALVLPYGSKMSSVLKSVRPNERSNMDAIQLFRKSVAEKQKESILASLKTLEANVLNTRSATSEVAALRGKEAELILQFIDRAKNIEPKGQVILGSRDLAENTLLEDGDVIRIPETSSVVMVNGEVLFPNAIVQREGKDADYYIEQAGGYSQSADPSHIVVVKQNGMFENASDTRIVAGDEIMVLPKVEVKKMEIAKGISQVLFQIAVAARTVILGR